jgi:hypothetical protein
MTKEGLQMFRGGFMDRIVPGHLLLPHLRAFQNFAFPVFSPPRPLDYSMYGASHLQRSIADALLYSRSSKVDHQHC